MINIIGTIHDNSVQHTVAMAEEILDSNYDITGKKQNLINEELRQDVSKLDSDLKNNKGLFASKEDLETLLPNPETGQYAIVYDEETGKWLIYSCEDGGTWTSTGVEHEIEVPDVSNFATKNDINSIKDWVESKNYQEKLVSGSNIKTINNKSILGSGDLSIEGGTTSSGSSSSQQPETPPYQLADSERNGYMSSQSYRDIQWLKTNVATLQDDVDQLKVLISSDNPDFTEIIERYQNIVDFINSIDEGDENQQLLSNILDSINSLSNTHNDDKDALLAECSQLSDRITAIEEYLDTQYTPSTPTTWKFGDSFPIILGGSGSNSGSHHTPGQNTNDNIKHIFLEQGEYERLSSYETNAIYFVYEPSEWHFGSAFPIILA